MSEDFTCIVIEDDVSSSNFIKNVLRKNFPKVKVLSTITSIINAKIELSRSNPDFVILDINLQDGNAFTLLRELDAITFKILFVTAHNKYAVEAFKFSALDFLLKPIYPDDLVLSIGKIIDELENQQYHNQLEAFFHNYNDKNNQKKLVLKNLETVHVVGLDEILYIESDNNYSNFHLRDGRKILISKTLKSFEEKLRNENFFRVHQSYIVNLSCVSAFDKKNDTVMLLGNICIPVAQRKRKELIEFLGQ